MGLTLRLDADGACRLIFDDRFVIDIEAIDRASGETLVHAQVGILPPAGSREATDELLLAGNLFGRGTGACTLGVDPDMREAILHRRLELARMEYHDFVAAIEDFLARVKAWTERLAKTAGSGETPSAGVDHPMLRI